MTPTTLRLRPGDDLRASLDAVLRDHAVEAAFVVGGIGSLGPARVRFAGARQATTIDGDVEILTLAGSLAVNGSHLHISVADASGRVFGGHLAPGSVVRTTAEILVVLLRDQRFSRVHDAATGYDELVAERLDRDRG